MKALSLYPDNAMLIACGEKTVECRTWSTDYRGDLLICSTARRLESTIPGHTMALVELVDVVPFTEEHLAGACLDRMPKNQIYAWILDNVRLIRPEPVKGHQSLWNYDGPIWEAPSATEEELDESFSRYYEPLIV